MNPQRDEDLQRRLDKLEAEIKSGTAEVEQPKQPKQTVPFNWLNLNAQITKLRLWFDGLSGTSKLIFGGVAVLLGLAIAQTLLKLVASAISLAVLAVLVYVGYKFFVSGNFQNKK